MRQRRNEGTKVWHNPEIAVAPRGSRPKADVASASDTRDQKQHRAALEALFAPRKSNATRPADDAAKSNGANADTTRSNADGARANIKDSKPAGRIVVGAKPEMDPRAVLRQKLLGKLLLAEGRPSVSKAANELLKAGFSFPDEQDVHLKLLEHADESMVASAMDSLSALLAVELPKRRAVLESRLRRIEEYADETATRQKASDLRRFVSARPTASR